MQLYVKRLCKQLFRAISLALLLTLAVTSAASETAKGADPTWTQTSQADFETGTLVNLDTISSQGDVMLAIDPSSEQLDQNNPNHSGNWHTIQNEDWAAQSFVAGLTGNLTKVALYLKKKDNPGQLTIEIRNTVGANYEPGETVYASITTNAVVSSSGQEYQFTLPTPVAVTSGTHYAIVLQEPDGVGGNGKYYWVEFRHYDIYPSGNVWESDDSGDDWELGGGGVHDFYFRTYIASGHYSSGTLTSSDHDTGYAADFGTISWNATTPTGTALEFQIATNSDNSTWNFKGPGGGSGAYYT
ncbi:choice-of-anchor R domain-containing protein [Chloroflexota bacterium]